MGDRSDFIGPSAPLLRHASCDAVTVVIIALLGGEALKRCAAAVGGLGIAVIIVDQSGCCLDIYGQILKRGSGVTSVPSRRRFGVEMVRTPFVALLEDTVTPGKGWLDAISPVLAQAGVVGVGGSVSIAASLPPKYRALGLCEYGRFQPKQFPRLATGTRTAGGQLAVSALAGANFAFRTDALKAAMPNVDDVMIDSEIFDLLRRDGSSLAFDPQMSVTYTELHPAGARLGTRFDHGRIFACRFYSYGRAGRRAVGALKSLVLPIVLFSRSVRQASTSMRLAPATMFCVMAQHIAWSVGEFVGSVFGAARDDLGHWN